ncbi:MAG: hypothetical protein O9327_14965 [Polaromonas sp.]|nr:hypothetical protein [Polaromonas sp.]
MSNFGAQFLDPVRPAWLRDGVRVLESADFNAASKFLHARLPSMASSLGWPLPHRPLVQLTLVMDQLSPGSVVDATVEMGAGRDLLCSVIDEHADGPVIAAEIAIEQIDPSRVQIWTTQAHSGSCFRISMQSAFTSARCWMPITKKLNGFTVAYAPPVLALSRSV